MLSHATQLKLLGKISVEWSSIEFLLSILLSPLLFTPEFLARTCTDHFSAYKLILAIKESIEIHDYRYNNFVVEPSLVIEIKEVIELADLIRSKRNRVSHFCWFRVSDSEIAGTSFVGGVPTSKKKEGIFLNLQTGNLKKSAMKVTK